MYGLETRQKETLYTWVSTELEIETIYEGQNVESSVYPCAYISVPVPPYSASIKPHKVRLDDSNVMLIRRKRFTVQITVYDEDDAIAKVTKLQDSLDKDSWLRLFEANNLFIQEVNIVPFKGSSWAELDPTRPIYSGIIDVKFAMMTSIEDTLDTINSVSLSGKIVDDSGTRDVDVDIIINE